MSRLLLFVFWLLGRLPLRALHALGAAAGWMTFWASPTYRRHLRENLAQAYPADVARRLLPQAVAHAGRGLLELPRVWMRPIEAVAPLVTRVSGWQHVEAAWQRGKGILFLTPHLGCFDITSQYYSSHAPITVLYRTPRKAWLNEVIVRGRTRERQRLAAADLSGVRTLLKALKRGEAVGMLPDQAPRVGEGRWLDFFGRPAYTMTLAARLAESGASVLFLYAERLPRGAGYHLRVRPPLSDLAGAKEDIALAINREIEALIRECPQQYLWGYNRYKRPAGAELPPTSNATPPN